MMKKIIISLGILIALILMVISMVEATAILTRIEITPPTPTVVVGEALILTAVLHPTGAPFETVTWASLDPTVGTVSPTTDTTAPIETTFTSLSVGSARITATSPAIAGKRGAIVGRTTIVVTPAPVDPAVVMGDVIGLVRNILFLVAALFVIFGAFTFVTAGGDDKKIETGRKAILYAFIAVVVAVVAHGIVIWIRDWAA